MDADMTPICKTCRHWYMQEVTASGAAVAVCRHPLVQQVKSDYVDGGYVVYPDCRVERERGRCGPEGVLYSPASWARRLVRSIFP